MTLFWLIADFLQQLASKNTWPWPLFSQTSIKNTWWPFFCSSPIFSRETRLLSQKSKGSSSPHISAPIHPACHAIPIPDDIFCCFCSSPIFPERTRPLSQKNEGSSFLHVSAPIHPCLPCNRIFSNRTFMKLRAECFTFSPGATWSHYATAPILDLTTPLHQYS